MSQKANILWIRNDFRLRNNEALSYAISLSDPLVLVFLHEDANETWAIGSASKWWLHYALKDFQHQLTKIGLNLIIRKGKTVEQLLVDLAQEVNAKSISWNRCYDSVGVVRDGKVCSFLSAVLPKIEIKTFRGNYLFEPGTIFNKSKKPFQIFTPFYNCVKNLPIAKAESLSKMKFKAYKKQIFSETVEDLNLLPEVSWYKGLEANWIPTIDAGEKILKEFIKHKIQSYALQRNNPGEYGTSRLSPYLHFGQISPKQICHSLSKLLPTVREPFFRQIIWREFAASILFSNPELASKSFNKNFEKLNWKENKQWLSAWQKGKTGYPIVDAGMRELYETGWMHNRVRMIVGSFLVKDLMIHWVQGAKWFWDTLVDADLANNTFGWQWVAGCGLDASPFFRIFNPVLQSKKFDPKGDYIKRFVPELRNVPLKFVHSPWTGSYDETGIHLGTDYPAPIVSHTQAKINALKAYEAMKSL